VPGTLAVGPADLAGCHGAGFSRAGLSRASFSRAGLAILAALPPLAVLPRLTGPAVVPAIG